DDDEDQMVISEEDVQLSVLCKACTWAIGRVKKALGKNTTVEIINKKLSTICNNAPFLKSQCRKFINKHLDMLIRELTTNDGVKTICIKVKACNNLTITEMYFVFSSNHLYF
uniref:Saposin B-type domain-containing protein n=1 Tax=Tetraodon nigroviridis TaxID=99883 RepID=H3C3Q8_TETNG